MAKSARISLFFCSMLLGSLLTVPWEAAAVPPVRAVLVPQFQTISPGQSFKLAVFFQIEPGWHIYWRNPGEAGIATAIQWQLPKGFKPKATLWPAPQKMRTPSLMDYGYSNQTALITPVETSPLDFLGTLSVELPAKVSWLACKNVCVPGTAEVSTMLEVAHAVSRPNPRWTSMIEPFEKKIPPPCGVQLKILESPSEVWIEGSGDFKSGPFEFFPYRQGWLDDSAPQIKMQHQGAAGLFLKKTRDASKTVRRLEGLLRRGSDYCEIAQDVFFNPSGMPHPIFIFKGNRTIIILISIALLVAVFLGRRDKFFSQK